MRNPVPPGIFTPFIAALFLSAFASSILGDSFNESIDWESASPSEIHLQMGKLKAERLEQSRLMQKSVGREKALATQTDYDVLFYDIDLDIDHVGQTLDGTVGIFAKSVAGGLTQVAIDFAAGLTIDSIWTISGVLSYTRAGDVVTVNLPTTYNMGEEFSFFFTYHGTPVGGGFQGFTFSSWSGAPVISSLSEPYYSRTWWPCKDRMDDKPDSFNIAITADTMFFVGSNGILDSTVHNGGTRETSYYRVRYPMATYLFSVAVSIYTVWEDEWIYNSGADTMPVVHAVFPDRYTYSLPRWGIIPDALTALSNAFGLYPFSDEKYGHSNFTWGGGMEHQTMTSMTGNSFGFNQNTVVHELGHQWWGDMITCEQWGHIWLNEGWAVYSEALYWEWVGGWNSYHAYMDSIRYLSGGSIYIQDTSSVNNIFGLIVYDKGGWVMHMLRNVLGDSLFFATINAYYNSPFQYGAATTEDFRDIAEATSGAELDWFFDQWIYGSSYPIYWWYDWVELGDTGGYDLHLRVRQVQSTDPQSFTMPIDVAVSYLGGAVDTLTLWMDEREKVFRLHSAANVAGIAFDPNNWILKGASHPTWKLFIITPNEDLAGATQHIPYVDTVESRGGSGSRTFSIVSGSLPPGLSIDNSGVISGTCADSGVYSFSVKVQDNNWSTHNDELPFTMNVVGLSAIPGDVALDNEVNVADLTYLVAYMFRNGPPPLVLNAADVNGSCNVDIADVTFLVSYMFKTGASPIAGCVN